MSATFATQSRNASFTASLSVRLPGAHGTDLGPEQLHAKDVELLALGVDLAHVHDAVHAEQRRRRGRRHAVLAGAGLGDEAALAHAPGQQRLADHVVELVRAGVGEVLALEQHPDPEALRQAVAFGDRRGPPAVVAQDGVELGVEGGIGPGGAERRPRARDTPA